MRVGPAKRKGKGSDTDHWGEGGVTYHSDFDDNNDEDLKEYLRTNVNFLVQMCSTGGFSVAHLNAKHFFSCSTPVQHPLVDPERLSL